MARRYYPAKREQAARKPYTGKVGDDKLAWLRTITGLWELLILSQEAESEERIGPGYRVRMPVRGGRFEAITLTILTEAELLAFRDFWERAIELALPVVRERDRIAAAAAAEGNDVYRRFHRSAPELVIRPGAFELYDPLLYDRPTDAAAGDAADIGEPDELRTDRGGVADGAPEDPEAEDDEPTAD